jgi:hypothetical protein
VGDEEGWADVGVDEDGEQADDTRSMLASAITSGYRRR